MNINHIFFLIQIHIIFVREYSVFFSTQFNSSSIHFFHSLMEKKATIIHTDTHRIHYTLNMLPEFDFFSHFWLFLNKIILMMRKMIIRIISFIKSNQIKLMIMMMCDFKEKMKKKELHQKKKLNHWRKWNEKNDDEFKGEDWNFTDS